MNAYLEMMRPNNGILAMLGIVIGTIVAGTYSSLPLVILAIVASFLINGAGNVINDYFDAKIDRINRPKRPIPSGRVKRDNAIDFFILLTAAGLVVSYFVSGDFLTIAIINSIVSLVYSWKLKGTPAFGNAAVSWLAASTFIAAALIVFTFTAIPTAIIILASVAFLGTLSREIYKDIEDVKGDKKMGAKTLPIVIGWKASRLIASIILLIAILSLFLPVYLGIFSYFYFIGMAPAALACLYAINAKKPKKAQKFVKIAMYFVFLGFILGTLF